MSAGDRPVRGPSHRAWVRAAFVVATLLILGPAFDVPSGDGFPFSNYPMFAADRGSSVEIHSVQGVRAGGQLVPLSPQLIARSPSPNLALITARGAARRGPVAMRDLCEQVAARAAQTQAVAELSGVALVRLKVDLRSRFASPEVKPKAVTHTQTTRLAECQIEAR